MKEDIVDSYSSSLTYSQKKEVIRRCLASEVTYLIIESPITKSELEILNILAILKNFTIISDKSEITDSEFVSDIPAAEKKVLIQNILDSIYDRVSYRMAYIVKAIEAGDKEKVREILGFKKNTRLLSRSLKECRLSDPKYSEILGKSYPEQDMKRLMKIGDSAKYLGVHKSILQYKIRTYQLMPDFISSKGILYFFPETLDKFRESV